MNEAGIIARGNDTYGPPHLHCLCLHQIVGLKVTEVQCQLPHQCHQGLIDLEVQGTPTVPNNATGTLEAIWKSTCQSSRMRKWKTPSLIKAGIGTWQCIATIGAGTAPSSPYAIHSLQDYPQELVRSLGTNITLDGICTILDEYHNNVKALDALNQELFQLWMVEKETVSDWGCACQGISTFWWHCSWNVFHQIASLSWNVTISTGGCLNGLKWW